MHNIVDPRMEQEVVLVAVEKTCVYPVSALYVLTDSVLYTVLGEKTGEWMESGSLSVRPSTMRKRMQVELTRMMASNAISQQRNRSWKILRWLLVK